MIRFNEHDCKVSLQPYVLCLTYKLARSRETMWLDLECSLLTRPRTVLYLTTRQLDVYTFKSINLYRIYAAYLNVNTVANIFT